MRELERFIARYLDGPGSVQVTLKDPAHFDATLRFLAERDGTLQTTGSLLLTRTGGVPRARRWRWHIEDWNGDQLELLVDSKIEAPIAALQQVVENLQ